MKFKNQLYPILISTTNIPDLQEITTTDSGVRVGASVTLTSLGQFMKTQIDGTDKENSMYGYNGQMVHSHKSVPKGTLFCPVGRTLKGSQTNL